MAFFQKPKCANTWRQSRLGILMRTWPAISQSEQDLTRAFDIYEAVGDHQNAVSVAHAPVCALAKLGPYQVSVPDLWG